MNRGAWRGHMESNMTEATKQRRKGDIRLLFASLRSQDEAGSQNVKKKKKQLEIETNCYRQTAVISLGRQTVMTST